jgi:2-methylcitrate dehydratase
VSPERYDPVLEELADYALSPPSFGQLAYDTARWDLLDALGCAVLALRHPACLAAVCPHGEGTLTTWGSRVPGTTWVLPPVEAAFVVGSLVRWLDYNDTFLAAEWGHPSDNLGGILAAMDHESQRRLRRGQRPFTVRDLLTAMIQAHEIQGVLSLENSLNRVGWDHVWWVKVATAAVVTAVLGGSRDQVRSALSHAFLDGASLRAYRHAPHTGPRKSWAAGDATARGVWIAQLALRGEPGYPRALSAPGWGFETVVLRGQPVRLARPLGSYVMENVLFKVAYPAEFHGQTAVEAAIRLHPAVWPRWREVERVVVDTQEPAMRIIHKTGPLQNPADRDHCLEYMVAVALLSGEITDASYSDDVARDPRIDELRAKIQVREEPRYSRDYLDPDKRSIANAVQVFFVDGTSTPRVEVEYPLGHPRRRAEALPLLRAKAENNLLTRFPAQRVRELLARFEDPQALMDLPVPEFVDLWVL